MKKIMWRINCILCIAVLVEVCMVNGDNNIASRTYVIQKDDGTKLTCNLCPPGTYLKDDCSVDGGDAKCETCPDGQYNGPGASQARSCAKCDKSCKDPERESILKGCTTTSNISCQCKEGYSRQAGSDPDRLCILTKLCPAGEGVVRPGNATTQTVCKPCGIGSFSTNESATEKCKRCSVCPEGQIIKSDCKADADTVCGTKSDGLSEGEIIGIAVGVGVGIAAIIVVLSCRFCECCAKFRKRIGCCSDKSAYEKCSQDGVHADVKCQSDVVVEMNGHYPEAPGPTQNGHDKSLQNGHDPRVQNGHETRIQNGDMRVNDRHQGALSENGTVCTSGHAIATHREDGYPIPKELQKVFNTLREDLVALDYQHFFRLLLPSEPDKHISEMVINYLQPYQIKEVIYRLLVRWVNLEKEDATMDKIVAALEEWNRPDLAAKYSKFISVQNNMDVLKDCQITEDS